MCIVQNCARSDALYHNVDAGLGMFYSVAIVGLARLLNYRCFLHHHSYSYLTGRSVALTLLDYVARAQSTHILLSNGMAIMLEELSRHAKNTVVMGNAILLPSRHPAQISLKGPLILGHLSRLGPNKGLPDVLCIFEKMATAGADVRLELAGPTETNESALAIRQLVAKYPGRVNWHGTVEGEGKKFFFDAIDVFLLPTRYKDEAQPLVLLEAMQAGKPCVAFGRGAIPELLASSGGCAIDVMRDFSVVAMPLLLEWCNDRQKLRDAGRASSERFAMLLSEAERASSELVRRMTIQQEQRGRGD